MLVVVLTAIWKNPSFPFRDPRDLVEKRPVELADWSGLKDHVVKRIGEVVSVWIWVARSRTRGRVRVVVLVGVLV